MRREPARALLIDLDGVLRRFDPEITATVERKYGLASGSLMATTFAWDVLRPAVAAEITHAEWMQVVATRLPLPAEQAAAALAEWQAYRGDVDPDVLAFVREVRAAGIKVGLATNATDLLRDDLDTLGLTGEFDAVISSYELKVHKPAPEFYREACLRLAMLPKFTLFVDDDDRAVSGARAAGLIGFRWTDEVELRYLRGALGISSPS